VNQNIPVSVSLWKDARMGALSVSVDDGEPVCFDELERNGFKGTYVTNGTEPPDFYSDYYNAGMELGAHTVTHPCTEVSETILRYQEIEPNIEGIADNTPMPLNEIITLVWPCGFTNIKEQMIASEYFLGARGYNINQLEDHTPDSFLNLKSYNSHEHDPVPPPDLKQLSIWQNKKENGPF